MARLILNVPLTVILAFTLTAMNRISTTAIAVSLTVEAINSPSIATAELQEYNPPDRGTPQRREGGGTR